MTTYKLRPEVLRAEKRKTVLLGALYAAILVVGGVYAAVTRNWEPWVAVAIVSVYVVLLVGSWVYVRNRRWLKMLSSYSIELGDDQITWKQAHKPDVQIRRKQVTHLQEQRRGIAVGAEKTKQVIFVTKDLDGYEDVKARLATWCTLETVS